MPRTIEFKGSSNVKAATLNDDGTCEVLFANGGKAVYKNFTPDLFKEWEEAESAGRWFHNRIRSKATDFPMVSQTKDGDAAGTLPEPPPAPAAAPKDELAAAQAARDAALKQLEEANARADKAEQENEQLRAALATAKKSASSGAKSTDFRPWRRGPRE